MHRGFVASRIRFVREFVPISETRPNKTMEFCLGKTGTPWEMQFATRDCLTTCVRPAKNRVDKTQASASAGGFCPTVRSAKPLTASPAPIASSVQASTPQIARFLLYSIAAFCEHRYSTHAYSICSRSHRKSFPRALTAAGFPPARGSPVFPPSCIGNTSIR
jgi:hypothetical protein